MLSVLGLVWKNQKMNNSKLLKTGIVGLVVTALCCFTPVLVVLFGVLGLSAVVGWLDYILLPLLAFFIGLCIYGVLKRDSTTKIE